MAGLPRPRVLVLEWTDPPYAPGHWLPDLITAAGGVTALGQPGGRSTRVAWSDVRAAAPDVVVVAPCGYDLATAEALTHELLAREVLPPDVPVWAADANASWTRPALRLVEAVESLAIVLHAPTEPVPGIVGMVRVERAARASRP